MGCAKFFLALLWIFTVMKSMGYLFLKYYQIEIYNVFLTYPHTCTHTYIHINTYVHIFLVIFLGNISIDNNELALVLFQNVVEVLESQSGPGDLHENTMLLVMGDHGQTLNGDHGGGSAEEV